MPTQDVMTGNKAVAHGVRLSRVQVIPIYPITPQTSIVEHIAKFIADGEMDAEYIHAESEHSAMAAAIGASLAGARVFTSTCSQGLAYMHECVAQATAYRTPILMAVVNRTLGWYWSTGPDYSDMMPEMNLGWIVVSVESNQEALDTVIQLYRAIEDPRVMLPAMLSLDGFYLSFSSERVEIPDQEEVDEFLPPYRPRYRLDPESDAWPTALLARPLHTRYRMVYEEVMRDSLHILEEVDGEFGKRFGRSYGGALDTYRVEDAEALLVTMGSMTTAARRAVDAVRKSGVKVGLVRVRVLRPFPSEELKRIVEGVGAVGVVDRVVLHGTGCGNLCMDVKSALYGMDGRPRVVNFVAGMGGQDVSVEDFVGMAKKTFRAAWEDVDSDVEYVLREEELVRRTVRLKGRYTIYPGSLGCAGCGASIILRNILKVLGEETILVIPPSCAIVNYSDVLGVPYMLANYASTASFQTGIIRAHRVLGRKGVKVVAFSGDGGTVDIGLQALSAAAERGEPIIWVCYDNEAYMNTGVQRSGSTPAYAWTTSTPVGRVWRGKAGVRKNMVLIMAAHGVPYIATASIAYLKDLRRKVEKAVELVEEGVGPAYIHVQQPCPTGWGFPPERTVEVARLAVQSRMWVVLEVDDGRLRVNVKPRKVPVRDYLMTQRRFRHLTDEEVERLQRIADAGWETWMRLETMGRLPWYT